MREIPLHSCCWDVYVRAWIPFSTGFPLLWFVPWDSLVPLALRKNCHQRDQAPQCSRYETGWGQSFLLAQLLCPSQKLSWSIYCLSPAILQDILHYINEHNCFEIAIYLWGKKSINFVFLQDGWKLKNLNPIESLMYHSFPVILF